MDTIIYIQYHQQPNTWYIASSVCSRVREITVPLNKESHFSNVYHLNSMVSNHLIVIYECLFYFLAKLLSFNHGMLSFSEFIYYISYTSSTKK